jgi:hypothetical protein
MAGQRADRCPVVLTKERQWEARPAAACSIFTQGDNPLGKRR